MHKATITSAPEAWKLLNGILCVYKPPAQSNNTLIKTLKKKLCDDLNLMKTRPQQTIVEFHKLEAGQESAKEFGKQVVTTIEDGSHRIEIVKGPSYADHPAVIGPRHQTQDIRYAIPAQLGFRSSGVSLVGINKGTAGAEKIRHSNWLRVYNVSGRFGIGTETFFDDGKVLEKATYHKIKRSMLERVLDISQASHQRLMFQAAGVPMDSQRAYDLASKGMLRPAGRTIPVVYSVKLLDYQLPDFQIEVRVINETEDYLATIIHEIGLKLHTVASCTKLRCVKHGPFELQNALLSKHWGVKNCIENIAQNEEILANFDLTYRDPLIATKVNADEEAAENEELTTRSNHDEEMLSFTRFCR